MISDKEFAIMKKDVRVINCARGGIIDEEALVKAIESGNVAGAALDVYEEEPPKNTKLLKLDKVVLTPHLGASTEEAQMNVAIDVANTVRDALLGRGVRNAVNVPCVDPEIYKIIEPYLKLAENIGAMQAQMVDGHINKVKIRYVGDHHQIRPFPVYRIYNEGHTHPHIAGDRELCQFTGNREGTRH